MVTLTSKPRILPPQGTHTAILYEVIDYGTQKDEFQGQVKFPRQVRMSWELCEELMESGKPFVISKKYNASANAKSAIVKDIKAWKPGLDVSNGFDVASLLGEACNLTIAHDEKPDGTVYDKVVAIAPLKKSEVAPQRRNPIRHFDLDNFDQAVFDSLPDFMKDIIAKSPEYMERDKKGSAPAQSPALPDDEIPF